MDKSHHRSPAVGAIQIVCAAISLLIAGHYLSSPLCLCLGSEKDMQNELLLQKSRRYLI